MDRAHVTMEDGREADILIREFRVDHSLGCEPEATIKGFLTRLTKREPQAPELTVVDVIYNDPATVVYWSDKTRTVVKCQPGDTYDPKTGFLLALCKKVCGNTGNYNDLLREAVPGYGKDDRVDYDHMRKELDRFCRKHMCSECPLLGNKFKCGRGYHFSVPKGGDGYIADEDIPKYYNAMKGANNHGHE